MLYIISGQVATWRGGERVEIPACSEHTTMEFPKYGRIKIWNMGHSEPVTIPRTFPQIEEVSFLMGFGRGASALIIPAKLRLFGGPRRINFAMGLIKLIDRIFPEGEPGLGGAKPLGK